MTGSSEGKEPVKLHISDIDIRDAFFDEIYKLGAEDRNVVFLTDDLDAFSLRKFKEDFPAQFINIGVAEQNMVNIAAGLATCGKKVFAYGIAPFVTMRCFEQIKVNLCSMNLPVTIIGVGAGFSFGFDGPTHHGTQDVSLMRSLPEITIYNPSDAAVASACAHLAYKSRGPVYVRLDKGKFPGLTKEGEDFSDGVRIVRPLRGTNIVATGFMTAQALLVADELERKGVRVGVVDLYRLKPIPEAFVARVIDPSKRIVTLEEHSLVGGLGSIVCEQVADHQRHVSVKRIGVKDRQFVEYGSREWFHTVNGLDVAAVVEALLDNDRSLS